jgi:hypothetical protein
MIRKVPLFILKESHYGGIDSTISGQNAPACFHQTHCAYTQAKCLLDKPFAISSRESVSVETALKYDA